MTRAGGCCRDVPDVLGLLCAQAAVTVGGHGSAASRGRAATRQRPTGCATRAPRPTTASASCATRSRKPFATAARPRGPLRALARIDEVINGAKDTVREAELMGTAPDEAIAEMAGELLARHAPPGRRVRRPGRHGDPAWRPTPPTARSRASATSSTSTARRCRRSSGGGPREVTAKRELYRRLVRAGGDLGRVAERVWYAVLKES